MITEIQNDAFLTSLKSPDGITSISGPGVPLDGGMTVAGCFGTFGIYGCGGS